jgi:hypothetical protein
MRSLALVYAADSKVMRGTDDYKFPTDMIFDNEYGQLDDSIL